MLSRWEQNVDEWFMEPSYGFRRLSLRDSFLNSPITGTTITSPYLFYRFVSHMTSIGSLEVPGLTERVMPLMADYYVIQHLDAKEFPCFHEHPCHLDICG